MSNGVPVDKVRIRCDCGAAILAPAALAGQQVPCPRCERLVRVVESVEGRGAPRADPDRRPPPRRRPSLSPYDVDAYAGDDDAYGDDEPAPRRAPRAAPRPRTRVIVQSSGSNRALAVGLAAAFFLGIVILVIVVRTNNARENERIAKQNEEVKAKAAAVPTPPAVPVPPANPIRNVGEPFDSGSFTYKATAVQAHPSIAGAQPPAAGLAYLVIEMEVTNKSKTPAEIPDGVFRVLDNVQQAHFPSGPGSTVYAAADPERFPKGPIPPGETRLRALVFELPDTAFGARALLQIAPAAPGAAGEEVFLHLPRHDGTLTPRR